MYKVLKTPFPFPAHPKAHAILVNVEKKDSNTVYTVIVQGTTQIQTCMDEQIKWFQEAAFCLNNPPSKEFKTLLLLSIEDSWRSSEKVRISPRRRTGGNFRADFGRMDIGQRQGFGRDLNQS